MDPFTTADHLNEIVAAGASVLVVGLLVGVLLAAIVSAWRP